MPLKLTENEKKASVEANENIMNEFNQQNPDYPATLLSQDIKPCMISDSDIPKDKRGNINGEGYTYGELRHQPMIPEVIQRTSNPHFLRYAAECNERNKQNAFRMFKVKEEWCFWQLRVGPAVKLPTLEELKQKLPNRPVESSQIRDISYKIIGEEIAKECGVTYNEARNSIGNVFECAPHEDMVTNTVYMVPNWAHRWFHHDGYVSQMKKLLNNE